MLPWIKDLTRRRIGQIWVHHANEQGQDYGDKTKEWQFDTVVIMKRVEEQTSAEIVFDLTFSKARERSPQNRSDYREGRVTLQGDVWRFSGAAANGRAAEIYDILDRRGVRHLSTSLSHIELAEAVVGQCPDGTANEVAEWKVRLGREVSSLKKALQRDKGPLKHLGEPAPGRSQGQLEWRWFLPSLAQ
jgi:hypothetical protein